MALDAGVLVNGRWSLLGSQENDIGTSKYHKYGYQMKFTWRYANGVFYINSTDYSNTDVSGNVLTAHYDGYGDRATVRIEFLDEDTATFTREGRSDAFGDYKVDAKATRVK
jgi:hypothetical protein